MRGGAACGSVVSNQLRLSRSFSVNLMSVHQIALHSYTHLDNTLLCVDYLVQLILNPLEVNCMYLLFPVLFPASGAGCLCDRAGHRHHC